MKFSPALLTRLVITHMPPPHRYAIMCGIMADYETVQNKIKNGYIFKVSCCLNTPCTLYKSHVVSPTVHDLKGVVTTW